MDVVVVVVVVDGLLFCDPMTTFSNPFLDLLLLAFFIATAATAAYTPHRMHELNEKSFYFTCLKLRPFSNGFNFTEISS